MFSEKYHSYKKCPVFAKDITYLYQLDCHYLVCMDCVIQVMQNSECVTPECEMWTESYSPKEIPYTDGTVMPH